MGMKEAYQEKTEAQLRELNAQIELLKAKADKEKAQAEIEYYKKLEALGTKHETVQERLQELKEAGDEAWEDLTAGVDGALSELRDAVANAVSRFE